jgi:hypothetical protein
METLHGPTRRADLPCVPLYLLGYAPMCAPSHLYSQARHLDSVAGEPIFNEFKFSQMSTWKSNFSHPRFYSCSFVSIRG